MTNTDDQTEKPAEPMFDESIARTIQETVQKVLLDHPELRSVGVFFDYRGSLNDANVIRGVWQCSEGDVISPDAVSGSMTACARMMGMIHNRVIEVGNAYDTALLKTMKEYADLVKQTEELKKQLAEAGVQPGEV